MFGEKFAAALGNLPPGQWQGPVESGYGAHVVFLAERTEGGVPALEEVREAVRREWTSAQQREAAAEFYQALLRKYAVTIEAPSAAANAPDPGGGAVMQRLLLLLVCLLAFAPGAWAHEVRPAYLELRQTAPDTYDVLWKVPALGDDMRLGVYVTLPEGSTNLSEPRGAFVNNAFIERWTVKRAGGLTGGTIHIDGLGATAIDVLVRVERQDGSTQLTRLTPSAPSFVVEATPSKIEVVRSYLALGVEHILGGVDHLLFVLALLIITRGSWRLIKTVTAFTVAHSITLSLAALGFVHVPSAPVEAVIALSIVFVAAEIVHSRQGRPGLTERAPWVVAFTFGLLHGFGFAGALAEIGLPQLDIPLALFSFNVGVEIGQLLFIAAVFAVVAVARQVMRRVALPRPAWAWRVAPYAIGSVSAFWLIQRVAAL